MISQANNSALDPIQIALAKPLDDFVAGTPPSETYAKLIDA